METDKIKMLVKRDTGSSHEDVELEIDWHDVSVNELRIMAKGYIMDRVMHDLKSETHRLKPQWSVLAKHYIHYTPPREVKIPNRVKRTFIMTEELVALARSLSKVEIETLLGKLPQEG